jgi:hypothetical protein
VLNADGSSRKSDPWVILVNTTQPTITATVNPDSSLSITISGLWAQVKQVFLSFSRNLSSVSKWVSDASQPFTFVTTLAKNAVDVVQQFFKSSGDVTITYDLQNYLGYGYQKLYERTITVPINLVTQTASITSVQDNSVTPAMAIANNGNTTDNTPVLSGTVSDALAQYYTVRIYDGGTYLGTATLDASNMGWTYTSRALAAGTHYLMAVVAKADGVEGTRSSEWVITVNAPVVRMTLPNTGITPSQCYSAGNNTLVNCLSTNNLNVQQDGHRSTQNAMAYSPVPNSSGGYDCVKDNNTGLYWEFKPRTYYVTERRSVNKFYTNYDNNSDDGSNPNYKYNINADSNSVGYVNWVNSQSSLLCGYSDWRIPTVYELHTLVNYNKQNYTPHIDPVFGITNNVWGGPIWTSSPRADLAGNAWCVDFDFGYVTASCARNMPARVLLVRGP